MEKWTVGSLTIAYEEQGEGEVLVLLHGFCGSSAYWENVAPLLADSFRVIMPDLRGHGASDAPLGAYTIEQMADDVALLLEELGVEKYAVLGHSMGGYIALSLAQRYNSRLSGFGLVHSTAYPDSDEAKEKRVKAIATINSEGITSFIDGLVPGLFAPKSLDKLSAAVDRVKELGYKTPPQGAVGAAMAMREREDRRDVLSSAPIPVLLVAGGKDGIIPPERTFTTDKEHVTKAVIHEAGHMSMYEEPQRLADIIKEFVSGLQ